EPEHRPSDAADLARRLGSPPTPASGPTAVAGTGPGLPAEAGKAEAAAEGVRHPKGEGAGAAGQAALWGRYLRQDVPPLFGLTFSEAIWNVGYVRREGQLFLLVTLEKEGLADSFQYQDRFLGPDLFQWQSQNRTRRDSADGRALSGQAEPRPRVHLFVRRAKKVRGKPAPFTYCGEVACGGREGDAPLTIRWRPA